MKITVQIEGAMEVQETRDGDKILQYMGGQMFLSKKDVKGTDKLETGANYVGLVFEGQVVRTNFGFGVGPKEIVSVKPAK